MAVIYGTSGPDTKKGSVGNDTMYGWATGGNASSLSGKDKLYGNAGNDNLKGGTGNVSLFGSAGLDSLYGGEGNDYLKGQDGNDKLYGEADDDTLDGGLGSDALFGGSGDDTYIIDSTGDTITEYFDDFSDEVGFGYIDTVQSSVSYTLGNNLENLTLTGSSNISGKGNALDNTISGNAANNSVYGNAGNDSLDGGLGSDTLFGGSGDDTLDGRLGSDTLIGGTGYDTYIVNSTTDKITESFNQGIDWVESSVNYTLGDNLENLKLTGSSNTTGIGNALDNYFYGNAGTNSLSGGDGNDDISGGENGNDSLYGGAGNDSLFGANGNNYLDGGNGNDWLSSDYWDIFADSNDTLTGGAGNDTLAGGFGNDSLIGGSGADYFNLYRPSQDGIDSITDFVVAEDTINVYAPNDPFYDQYFGDGLIAGAVISVEQFVIGSAAGDASDRFIYNQKTGALFFDVDGTGATGQVQLASLSTGLAMTNADIFVMG